MTFKSKFKIHYIFREWTIEICISGFILDLLGIANNRKKNKHNTFMEKRVRRAPTISYQTAVPLEYSPKQLGIVSM